MTFWAKIVPRRLRVILLGGGAFLGAIISLNFGLEVGPESRSRAFALVILSLLLSLGGLLVFLFREVGATPKFAGRLKVRVKPALAFCLLFSIFVANYFAVGMRTDAYPFYSVKMFHWSGPETQFPQVYYVEKYGYEEEGEVIVVDLRREGSWLYQEFLPWTFGHSASFSSTFHNRTKAQNLEFLKRETGLNLFVVVQQVDLSTGEVSLVEGFCAYDDLRDEIPYYYGPLAIPTWQSEECS